MLELQQQRWRGGVLVVWNGPVRLDPRRTGPKLGGRLLAQRQCNYIRSAAFSTLFPKGKTKSQATGRFIKEVRVTSSA